MRKCKSKVIIQFLIFKAIQITFIIKLFFNKIHYNTVILIVIVILITDK